MKTTAKIVVPDGKYTGHWTGHSVTFVVDGQGMYFATTEIGVRGRRVLCTVTVRDNELTVESNDDGMAR